MSRWSEMGWRLQQHALALIVVVGLFGSLAPPSWGITSANALQWDRPVVDSKGFLPRFAFGADSTYGNNVAYLFGGVKERTKVNLQDRQVMGDLYSLQLVTNDTGDEEFVFTQLAPAAGQPSARKNVGLAATDEYVLIVGGLQEVGPNATEELVADTSWLYSVAQNTWTNVTTGGPSMRANAAVVKPAFSPAGSGTTKFYVHGGQGESFLLNDFWEFDASTFAWRQITLGTPAKRQGAQSFMFDKRAYFYGGVTDDTTTTISMATLGTTLANIWQSFTIDEADVPRLSNAAVAPVAPDMVYVYGGALTSTPCGAGAAAGVDALNDETYLVDVTTSPGVQDAVTATQVLVQGGKPTLVHGQGIYLEPYFLAVGGYTYRCDGGVTSVPEPEHIFGQVYRFTVVLPTGAPTMVEPDKTSAPTMVPSSSAPTSGVELGWVRTSVFASIVGMMVVSLSLWTI